MKKLIILAVSVFALFTSCQQRPQVFGVYIDGTFEQFLKDLDKEPWKYPINIDTILHLSESKISIKAYSTEVIDLNEDSVKVDSIYITIELEKEKSCVTLFIVLSPVPYTASNKRTYTLIKEHFFFNERMNE